MSLKHLVALILFLTLTVVIGQEDTEKLQLTERDSIVTKSWIAGLGFNAVDDAGSEFSNFFNATDNWNIVPFPSRLSIGKYFENGLGIELIGSYNQYQEGKVVDDSPITEEVDYYSADIRFSYDLNKILGETGFFDPYVGLGVGYTDANNQGRGTYNASLGFRAWISDKWGLDFNSTGKWTMTPDNSSNHLQHAAGVVYRFAIKKGLSKKGEEKLARIKEIEEEQKRLQDSIIAAQQAEEEARLLAQRLKREEENRIDGTELEKSNSGESRKKLLANQINSIGQIYFDFNSSYLSADGKVVLDNLIKILKENPNVVIQVKAHSDSRGSEEYNLWLSQRRVERTKEYLESKGINTERVELMAMGESNLMNDCGDGVNCPEEKHRENRRSEFAVVRFKIK